MSESKEFKELKIRVSPIVFDLLSGIKEPHETVEEFLQDAAGQLAQVSGSYGSVSFHNFVSAPQGKRYWSSTITNAEGSGSGSETLGLGGGVWNKGTSKGWVKSEPKPPPGEEHSRE
jgi:hypothetical protein